MTIHLFACTVVFIFDRLHWMGYNMEEQLIACQAELLNARQRIAHKKKLTDKEATALMLLLHEAADVIGIITQTQRA